MPRKKFPQLTWSKTQQILEQIAGPEKSKSASKTWGYESYQDFTQFDKKPPEPPKQGGDPFLS